MNSTNILTDSQAGFRTRKGTQQQLQSIVNVIEDAKAYQQDLLLLSVDFASAFNTCHHDILLATTRELGFTQDAVSIVQDLYTNAYTLIRTEHGLTPPIHV